jgi:CO/xanthine dehydrogenase FAD-binding subunit
MKPAPFEYEAPRSLDAALALLGDDAIALAGGQSLVPMMNFRLARPALLVDVNAIAELAYLRRSGGALRIGALTRQAELERSELVERGWPLLGQAVRLVGHAAIRSRGTVGGSVAHADPAAELPAALVALDARFHLRSVRGGRIVAAAEFFRGELETALEADELLTEIEVPAMPTGARTAFVEHTRTHGDFAIAGAALVMAPAEHAAVALLGAGPTPIRAPAAERALVAGAPPPEAARLAAGGIEHEYRRALVGELVRRAIEAALR